MKRREFIFRTAQASLLLSPVLSIRRAEAQILPPKRVFFFLCTSGYPDPEAFFPTGTENNFQLSPILSGLNNIKDQMVVIDNLNIRPTGPNPNGAEHARSIGKIMTAKDLLDNQTGNPDLEGELGGISIDQLIARDLNLRLLTMHVEDRYRANDLRSHPFATGPRQPIRPLFETDEAWDRIFRDFIPGGTDAGQAAYQARMKRLRSKRSILDSITEDLRRFRLELSGIEKLKLDVHEDSIRRSEELVRRELEEPPPPPMAECRVPNRVSPGSYIPDRTRAHLELLYNAFACNRIQVGSMMWGSSGYHWNYGWIPNFGSIDSIHNVVHHDEGRERNRYILSSGWDWQQIGDFARRLRDTPDGAGNLLDSTLIVGLCNFGRHHRIDRIPVVLFGNMQGQIRTNRFIRAPEGTYHDKLFTSVARMMGLPLSGFGDDPNCGPLEQL